MKFKVGVFCLLATVVNAYASSYSLPPVNESLIGNIEYTSTSSMDSVVKVAQRYDLGIDELEDANPHLNMEKSIPSGATIQLPTQHLLPDLPRNGIVVNLPEMRIYYYLPNSQQVLTFPVGIGKIGKTIPITKTAITRKAENPSWIPTPDIRQYNLDKGIVLPKVMPPGPDNPLGPYAIYMRIPTYLFHSTIFPESVGTRASFGCLRMYEDDIKSFFPTVQPGLPVTIINSPVKVGWQDESLYVEAYQPLEEHHSAYDASLPGVVHTIVNESKNEPTLIDWQQVAYISEARDGIPHSVGIKISP